MDETQLAARQCLLLCARSQLDDALQVQVSRLLHAGVDWQYLLDLAHQHNLLPLAYDRLRRLDSDLIPSRVMDHLKGSYYTNLLRNRRLQADLVEAISALQRAGIEPIVLKGGALARTVYADPGLRPMTDLDLLVPPQAMERAGTVLASIGYRLSGRLSGQPVAFQRRLGGRLEWLREHDGHPTHIDLQHHLVGIDLCRQRVDPGDVGRVFAGASIAVEGVFVDP